MNKEEHKILGFYERNSKTYDESRFQSRGGRELNLTQQVIVGELCGDIESKEVLELATGTGRFTIALAEKKVNLTGVDTAISMLKITRQKISDANFSKSPCLIRADITRLPFRNQSFDYVICINAINHIPKYVDAIKESARVLKLYGFFVANFPCMLSFFLPIALLINARMMSLVRPVFARWFTLSQIFRELLMHDLEVKDIQGHAPVSFVPFFKINDFIRKSFLRYVAGVLFVKAQKNKKLMAL